MCGNPLKKIGRAIEKPFRTGASSAKAAANQQAQQADQAYNQQQQRLEEERRAEEARKANIARGRSELDKIFGGLSGLADDHQQAYMNFAQPQLQDQYRDAQRALTFALANQGQLNSSVTGDRWARLERDHGLQQQQMADTARGYGNQARQDMEGQRQSLMSMLNSTADVNAVTNSARNQVSTLQELPTFTALGPLFQNATAGLGANLQGRQQAQMNDRTSSIIYGGDPDRGTGRVIR